MLRNEREAVFFLDKCVLINDERIGENWGFDRIESLMFSGENILINFMAQSHKI